MKKTINFFICLILFSCKSLNSQEKQIYTLNNNEYNVINDIFSDVKDSIYIYDQTDSSKTWSYLIQYNHLDILYGQKCNNGLETLEWHDIFSENDLKKIRSQIIKMHSFKLDKSKLSEKISLINKCINFSGKKNIISITKPIIVNDYAIIKSSSHSNESIIIASKSSNKWIPICRKWIYSVIDD
jgi:hypothetical protein